MLFKHTNELITSVVLFGGKEIETTAGIEET